MTRQDMEARRLKAVEHFKSGNFVRAKLSRELGVSRTSLYRWLELWKDGASMFSRKASGRPPRRSSDHDEILRRLYSIPEQYGRKRWSTAALSKEFQALTGIRYDSDHLGRIIIKMGLREAGKYQKGARRDPSVPEFFETLPGGSTSAGGCNREDGIVHVEANERCN